MPYICTHTSVPVSKQQETALKAALGEAIALIPGKSERWLMVECVDNCRLYFNGSDAEPMAFVEVKVYGKLAPVPANNMTQAITEILGDQLSIPAANIYIKYEETALWGWNGNNF